MDKKKGKDDLAALFKEKLGLSQEDQEQAENIMVNRSISKNRAYNSNESGKCRNTFGTLTSLAVAFTKRSPSHNCNKNSCSAYLIATRIQHIVHERLCLLF